ncbi:NUDIX domain-containing protein [Nakamurella endophytica]|uniref:Mutator protein MutT3 (MutT/nudix family) n=1 Tax=Nakamurella endophytica TaxID=1748367 RepID=A0A917SQ45_9ACTN|nr:NUDIX hydrolase [Nakamurella endophytica]GGL93345.1 putative mutator protein MutT3 (MutT/nudix family) [Nakamurella endophytica]
MDHDGDGWVRCSLGHRHWGRFGAAGLLVHRDGSVLLQHRSDAVAHPGTWSVPGGARDSHESPEQAALREAGEEAGIRPADVRPVGSHVDDHGGWSYVTVVASWLRPLRLRPNWEGAELRWLPIDEVTALPLHPHFAESWTEVRAITRHA